MIGTLLLGSAPLEAYGLIQQVEDLFLDLGEAAYLGEIESPETVLSATTITSHPEAAAPGLSVSG